MITKCDIDRKKEAVTLFRTLSYVAILRKYTIVRQIRNIRTIKHPNTWPSGLSIMVFTIIQKQITLSDTDDRKILL